MPRTKPFDGAGELLIALEEDWQELEVIRRKLGLNYQTLYNRLRVLEQYELVESMYEEKAPGRRFLRLSEKGKIVKKHLVEIYKVLGWLES